MRRSWILGIAFCFFALKVVGQESGVFQPLQSRPSGERRATTATTAAATAEPITGDTLPPKTISFTYDDGPDEYTLAIAAFLYDQGIKATFFVNGCRLEGSPPPEPGGNCRTGAPYRQYPVSILATLRALGHRIANHTEDHVGLTGGTALDPDFVGKVARQLSKLQTRLDPLISDGVFLFRAPWGAWDEESAKAIVNDPNLTKLVGPFSWDVGGIKGDWNCLANSSMTIDECGHDYLDQLLGRDGQNGIILMHDRIEGAVGSGRSLLLTKWLVEKLPRPEFRFVPLDAIPGPLFKSPTIALWSSEFSDAAGWGQSVSCFASIHLADVNGDHQADVCGRADKGIRCALSSDRNNESKFEPATDWITTDFSDDRAWNDVQYGSTIQFADINGDGRADVCGRGVNGMRCALALTAGDGFGPAEQWSAAPDFSDSEGWNLPQYFSSIRLADVNGDGNADACGRSRYGIVCGLSTGVSFSSAKLLQQSEFTDEQGWTKPSMASTIQFGDINGDGRDDVCGRKAEGIICALSGRWAVNPGDRKSERPFKLGPASYWTPLYGIFSDKDGWGGTSVSKYASIHLVDVDGDSKADLCGRNETGIVCARSNGTQFIDYRYVVHNEYTDELGWAKPSFGSTVQFADLDGDGRADVCGRGYNGMMCGLWIGRW